MKIQEVCRHLNITRKAVEYYIEQGLLRPSVLENGYRQFSQENIEQLRKITILRKLGLGISQIRSVLSETNLTYLRKELIQQELQMSNENERLAILRELSQSGDWKEAETKLETLDQKTSVSEKIMDAFPNDFGLFIVLHFSHFFPVDIQSESQQSAYEEIINYLDDTTSLEIPVEWSNWMNEHQSEFSVTDWRQLSADMVDAARHPEAFWEKHQQPISTYLEYKQSEAYLQSSAFQMQQLLQRWQQESGYHERFIPALKRLSPAYSEYVQQLEQAGERLRDKYS